MSQIISQVEIEKALLEEGRNLRHLVPSIAESAQSTAQSETAYKVAFAQARLIARAGEGKVTEAMAEDLATVQTADERLKYLTESAILSAKRDELRVCQARIDALRTLMASIRNVT